MNRLNFLLSTTALTAALVGTIDRASAGTIVETESYGLIPTPYSGQTLNFVGYSGEGGVNQLTSVVVTETDTVNGTVTASNTTSSSLTFSAGVKNVLTLSFQPANLTLPTVVDFSNTSGKITLLGGSSYTTPNLTGSKSATSNATGSLNDFLGGWSLTFGETGNYAGTAGTGINLSAATEGAVTVTVDYNYSNTVPEPMTIALLGTGLAGIGVIRRRRAKG
jgi:hypothetical protein